MTFQYIDENSGYRERAFIKSYLAEHGFKLPREFREQFGNACYDPSADVVAIRVPGKDDAVRVKISREGTASREILEALGCDDTGCNGDRDNELALLSIRDIERKADDVGSHYFDRDTMRFFRSRVSEEVFPCYGAKVTYFVTSEQNHGFGGTYPRLYSVRLVGWFTGRIDTVGEFQAYRSLKAAKRAARAAVTREQP